MIVGCAPAVEASLDSGRGVEIDAHSENVP